MANPKTPPVPDPSDVEIQECKTEGDALLAALPAQSSAAGVGAPAGFDPERFRKWIERVRKLLDLFGNSP